MATVAIDGALALKQRMGVEADEIHDLVQILAGVFTALIVAVSFALTPDAWFAWGEVLSRVAGRDGTWAAIPIPFMIRFPVATTVVASSSPTR